jgi:hypothetical protein
MAHLSDTSSSDAMALDLQCGLREARAMFISRNSYTIFTLYAVETEKRCRLSNPTLKFKDPLRHQLAQSMAFLPL